MSRPAPPKKITMGIPCSLYEEADQVTVAKLRRELEQGYIANARLSKRIHSEFDFADAEQT